MADVVIPDVTAAPRIAIANPPAPPNLLGLGAQALQMRGQMLANQSAQNDLTGRMAAGRDFQASINPLTGQIDAQAYNRRLATDGQAAWVAPQFSQQGLNNVTTQLQNQGINQHNAIERLKWTYDSTGALLAKPGGATRADVIDGIADAVKEGILSPKEGANIVPTIPSTAPQIQQWLKMNYAKANAGIQAVIPHVSIADNGKYQIAYNTNPAGGSVGPMQAPVIQNTLSPSQAAQPVNLPTPSGATRVTTLGDVATAASGGPSPRVIATGPTTQQSAANQVAGTAQGNQAASVVADATNLAQTRAALQGIRVELPNANGGPLAGALRNVGATLGELGITGLDQATAYDLLQKGQAQVVVSRVADGLGVPTDGKMAALSAQTPGTHMTGQAGAVAVGQIEGILDYQFARAKAAQAAGVTDNPASSSQFNLKWQERFPNASVFQFPYLSRKFQQEYWHQMSPAQQQAFKAQYRYAANAGFVQPNPFNNK